MANEVVLGIKIQADGSIAVKQIGDVKKSVTSLGEGSASTFDQMKAHWVAATAVIYGSLKTIQTGWNLADTAARVQEQTASLDTLAARYGTTASQITGRISQVSGGLIGQAAAAEVAAQSLTKNLSPDQIYHLADAAETLSNVTGKTAADSFRELSAAVALGRERAMEGSAGAIDLRDKHGELASMVTEAERRQLLYNEVLARANELKRQGVGVDDSAADMLERFSNTVSAAKLQVGNLLLQGVVPLAQGMTLAIQAAQEYSAEIKAAAVATGVFAAAHFLAGSAAVAKFVWGIQNAGFVLQYFATVTLGPMLVNPLTWIAVAVAGLAYLWIKLGQSTAEARMALDQYRASIAALNAAQRAEELAKQKAYLDELASYIQQKREMIENSGPSLSRSMQLDQALSWKKAAEERVKMLSEKAPGIAAPADTGYSERLKRLEDMEREYLNRKELAGAAELDRELLQLNHWYDEQVRTLDRLSSDQKHYDALYAAYSESYDQADYARSTKFADAALEIHRKEQQDRLALSVARGQAELALEEQRIAESQKLTDLAQKGWWGSESDFIRARAAAERASLDLQLRRVNLKELELTIDGEFAGTQAELAAIEGDRALLQERIESSKRVETYELDMRRVELAREINELTRQQSETYRQQQLDRAKEALGKIGGGEFAQSMGDVAGLAQGMEAGVATGEDQYSREYQAWAALQDQKILKMEEIGASEQAIKDAFREYDLQAEAAVQQQKLAMASAGFGMMAGMAQAFYVASGNRNKELFALTKAFRIGEAIMNTYAGATQALSSMPYPYNLIAAASVIAFGMAQVSSIASAKPGGSAASVSVPGGGGVPAPGGSPAPSGLPVPQEGTKREVNVNLHVYGSVYGNPQEIGRELAPYVTLALEDGVR